MQRRERRCYSDMGINAFSGHPHSQNPSGMGIPVSYYLSDLGCWEWGRPKRGYAHTTVTPGTFREEQ